MAKRFAVAGIALLALVAAACAPEPPAAPEPTSAGSTTDAAAGAAGPASAPGAAWRAGLVTGLASWADTSACGAQGAADHPAGTPVGYVAVSADAAGRPAVHTFVATSVDEKQDRLAQIEAGGTTVVSVDVDVSVRAAAIDDPVYLGPPASAFGPQWGIDKAGFEAAWGNPLAQGTGIRVAVIDSGVHATHEDLGTGAVVAGTDYVSPGDGRVDPNGHGTHVAGILGARDNTVGGIGGAPAVTIVPVRVLAANGNGSLSDVVDAVFWAADPARGNADVINLSLGSSQCSEAMFDALSYAVEQGVTVAAAAGNCGCTTPLYPAAFAAQLEGVLAVASTTEADARSSFSNLGTYLTLAAPGSVIWSTVPSATNNTYEAKNGTSMASPFVAAAAALVKAKCPAYTPAQVQQRLVSTVLDLGVAGPDTSFGAGRLQADVALAQPC